jgi:hypothetical protein
MPDTLKRPMTPDEFRAASDAFLADITPLLERHRVPLGGEGGLIHALVEVLGSLCHATLDVAPQGKPFVLRQLDDLRLYVETAGSTPQ